MSVQEKQALPIRKKHLEVNLLFVFAVANADIGHFFFLLSNGPQ